jgi:hypothetical protein
MGQVVGMNGRSLEKAVKFPLERTPE